mgnify:CR=1 FL=1
MKRNFIKAVCGVLAASLLAGLTALPAAATETPWTLSEDSFSITAGRLSTPDGKAFGDDLSLLCDGNTTYREDNYIVFDTYVGGTITARETAVEIDLKALVHPEKMVIYGGSASWGCEPSYDYDVYAAGADRVFSETPVHHFATETTSYNRTDTIDLSGLTESVRYLKIVSNKQRNRLAYTEFEVYGTADTTHPTTYTVRYLNAAGEELLPSRTVSAQAYSSVTETAPVIEGYTPFYTSQTLELLPDAENELVFSYVLPEISIASVTTLMTQEVESNNWIYSTLSPISAVIDGDDTTVFVRRWADKTVLGSIDFTLDSACTPDAMRLQWGVKGNKYTHVATSYAVFGSDDGIFYRPLYKTENAAAVTGAREDFVPLENAQNIRYLRLCVYEASGNSLTLADVTLYGATGTAPETKFFPISAEATQAESGYPVTNVLDNTDSMWRAGIWQTGSEGNAEQADAVMTLTLPQMINLDTLNLSLTPHIWDPSAGTYDRKVTLSAFEVEVSQDGVNYRKVHRYDGNATAITGSGRIEQSYGIVVSDFTDDVSAVKYVRLTFKKFSHLSLQSVFVTGELPKIPFSSVTTLMTQELESNTWIYSTISPITAVIDGDETTVFVRRWADKNVLGSINFTLNGVYSPDVLRLSWGVKGNKYTSTPSSYAVFGSDDGMFYRLLYRADSIEAANGAREDLVPLENAQNIRYLRLCVYEASGNSLTLAEATLYGAAGTTPETKIFPISAEATQAQDGYPVSNILENTDSMWRAGIWQTGSEGNAEQADAVMTLTLPQWTSLETLNLSLVPHVWDPSSGAYDRKVTLSAFEVEVSEDGVNYRMVHRYDGDATAITGSGRIEQSYGIVVNDFTADVSRVKYVRLTFKKFSHLSLQSVFVTGQDMQNGLRTQDVQVRLGTENTRAGLSFTGQAIKAQLGLQGIYDPETATASFGMMIVPKSVLENGGYATIAAMIQSGNTANVLDIPVQNPQAQDDETITFTATMTQIPLDDFNTTLCFVPYVKENGSFRFGKQTECVYTTVADAGKFLYPESGIWAVNVEDFRREIDGKQYFDVCAAASVTPIGRDATPVFPIEAPGYYIAEGTFEVDADTMWRVLEYAHTGNGAIKWLHFSAETYTRNPDQYDGVLPVSKMEDPLYVQMCVPNETASYMGTAGRSEVTPSGRTNASNLYELTDRYVNALPIGAIYANPEKDLPDDAQITLCFGKITLAARSKDSDGWFIGSQIDCKPVDIYPLPWTLENDDNPVKSYRLSDDKVVWVNDHYEIKLTGADIKGTSFADERVNGSILHFWGDFYRFEKGSDVLGIATGFTVWVKEPEWAGYMTAAVGADIRGADGYCQQAFAGINFDVTAQPRTIYGHNVGPNRYDTIMDSATVQQLLGIN